mmetsp:Transcript_1173/g.1431  ORF Transcript_1173/g.1431 Transcript_1173/m.1431 type:complete len:376 (-) Transcript_1173:434-1561(-)
MDLSPSLSKYRKSTPYSVLLRLRPVSLIPFVNSSAVMDELPSSSIILNFRPRPQIPRVPRFANWERSFSRIASMPGLRWECSARDLTPLISPPSSPGTSSSMFSTKPTPKFEIFCLPNPRDLLLNIFSFSDPFDGFVKSICDLNALDRELFFCLPCISLLLIPRFEPAALLPFIALKLLVFFLLTVISFVIIYTAFEIYVLCFYPFLLKLSEHTLFITGFESQIVFELVDRLFAVFVCYQHAKIRSIRTPPLPPGNVPSVSDHEFVVVVVIDRGAQSLVVIEPLTLSHLSILFATDFKVFQEFRIYFFRTLLSADNVWVLGHIITRRDFSCLNASRVISIEQFKSLHGHLLPSFVHRIYNSSPEEFIIVDLPTVV